VVNQRKEPDEEEIDFFVYNIMSILRRVPPSSGMRDNRRQFFIDNANSEKYYYIPIGDVPHHPNRNTLVPLGTFLGFINYRGQARIPDEQYLDRENFNYFMRFSNPPYNGQAAVKRDQNLVYTDQPPAAGSVPLHYYDYVQLNNPDAFDENGRPTFYAPTFGDGETQELRNSMSRMDAINFVAKRGGKKTRNRKNRKSKKTQKYKKRRGRR
jgi:hypothetical protein